MEVEGRKDAKRLERMVEEETKCHKRKLKNIFEIEKSEPSELVSRADTNHELRKFTESSFSNIPNLLLGEGATNKSCGESKTT